MTEKESQNQKVLAHLLDGKPLTPSDALRQYGVGRLASRVHYLKQKGWRIKSRMITVTGRDFNKVRVAQYYLDKSITPQAGTQKGLFDV